MDNYKDQVRMMNCDYGQKDNRPVIGSFFFDNMNNVIKKAQRVNNSFVMDSSGIFKPGALLFKRSASNPHFKLGKLTSYH